MADEPLDAYTDLASINITPVGTTLLFLRSLPVPVSVRDAGDESDNDGPPSTQTVDVELIARIRMSHSMALSVRDLIDRSLKRWESGERTEMTQLAPSLSRRSAEGESGSEPEPAPDASPAERA